MLLGGDRARAGAGPALIELVTYRRPGHAHHDDDRFHGSPESGVAGYEYDEERLRWEAADPIELYEARLLAQGLATPADIAGMRHDADAAVADAVDRAASAQWPLAADYRERVYATREEPASAPADRRPSAWPTTRRCDRRSSRP